MIIAVTVILLSEYRRILGWGYGRKNNSELDTDDKLGLFE